MNSLDDLLFDDSEETVIPKSSESKDPNQSSVSEVIDTDYKRYAMYVLENRAIPSVIDGFKPVQRKLFYAMQKETSKKVKAAELGGKLSSYGYLHGETSAQTAVVSMAQAWANNIPEFLGHGNFGTRLIQEAAAPRYIYLSQNPTISKIFIDSDVMKSNDDPDHPEPHHYLPIIPWVLVNGVKGIAVGFAVSILPRSPKDLIDACQEYLKSGTISNQLLPTFPDFKGSVLRIEDSKYQTTGIVEKGNRNSYVITELPWGYDREAYFNILVDLVESKKISSFEDHCDKSGFKFIVKLDPEQRDAAEKDILKYFKLVKIHSENYTTLDEHGKLKVFNHVHDIISYFCDYRLKKKKEQLDVDIAALVEDIDFVKAKIKFIRTILSEDMMGKIAVMKKKDFMAFTQKVVLKEEYVDYMIKIPVYSIRHEEADALEKQMKKKEKDLSDLRAMKPADVMAINLKAVSDLLN